MSKYEQIKERYMKNFVTDEQLLRYKELGVLTEEQYEEIYLLKHSTLPEVKE